MTGGGKADRRFTVFHGLQGTYGGSGGDNNREYGDIYALHLSLVNISGGLEPVLAQAEEKEKAVCGSRWAECGG